MLWQAPTTPLKESWPNNYGADASWMAGGKHWANDLSVKRGQPVYPIASGKVVVSDAGGGYGNRIVVLHGTRNGKLVTSLYGHGLNRFVQVGEIVSQDKPIMLGNNTGHSTGDHLHLEIRESTTLANRYAGKPYSIFDLAGKEIDFPVIGGEVVPEHAAKFSAQEYRVNPDNSFDLIVYLMSVGRKLLSEGGVKAFYRRDPNVRNPVTSDTSLFVRDAKDGIALTHINASIFTLTIPVRYPIVPLPKGLYREDFQLANAKREWLDDGFNVWFGITL